MENKQINPFSNSPTILCAQSTHKKGWGKEIWWKNTSDYCIKYLDFNNGSKGSMHFHVEKQETFLVISGLLAVICIDTNTAKQTVFHIKAGDFFDIPRLCPHQIWALQDSRILEISTTHKEEDSYRVQTGDSQK